MEIERQNSDEAILREMGSRFARIRLNQNQKQAQLAELAGVSKRTIERLESGQSIQLSSFIRVCRELDLIKRLDVLIPEPTPSPMDQFKLQGKVRRRASTTKADPDSTKKWTWGDGT